MTDLDASANQRGGRRVAALLTAALLLTLVVLRLFLVPPVIFLEGDDAALCAGIARLSAEGNVGPYYFYPPSVPVQDRDGGIAKLVGETDPSLRFYRYDSMLGMYFLGYLTRGFAGVAERMAWICFAAGTLAPLLFALFLVRFLRASAPLALPLVYLAIATSPESWVSGSAYINDKVVAGAFLAATLWLLTIANERRRSLATVAAAGVSMGFAALMRLDTVVFLPALALLFWTSTGSLRRGWRQWLAMTAIAAIVYGLISAYMRAPPPLSALLGGGGKLSWLNLPGSPAVLLSAFGPLRPLLFVVGMAALIVATERLRRTSDALRLRSMEGLQQRVAVVVALIATEVVLLSFLVFKSQKYVLISSSLLSGIAVLLPILLWQVFADRNLGRGYATIATLLIIAFGVEGCVKLGEVASGEDGLRFVGGHFLLRLDEPRDVVQVRALFAELDENRQGFAGEIVVIRPSWLMQQTIAYEAAERRWANTLRRTQVVDSGAYRTLNRYALMSPAYTIALLVPADVEPFRYPMKLAALRQMTDAGQRSYFLRRGGRLKPLTQSQPTRATN